MGRAVETAEDVLALLAGLPEQELARVRRALRSEHGSPGGRARRAFVDLRSAAVHQVITERALPTTGRGAWLRILRALMEQNLAVCLTRKLRPGQTLDTMASFQLTRSLVSAKSLRREYLAWLRRRAGQSDGSD
jgi:hypothetical protein